MRAPVGPDAYPRLTTVFADQAYQGPLIDWMAGTSGLSLEIVRKLDGQATFVVLPKRWIVERTLAWLMRYGRLRSDSETTTASGVGWLYTSMIHLMVRRLASSRLCSQPLGVAAYRSARREALTGPRTCEMRHARCEDGPARENPRVGARPNNPRRRACEKPSVRRFIYA